MAEEKVDLWEKNEELGTWEIKTDKISISVSLWQHKDWKNSYLAATRWIYKDKNFATYLKIQDEDEEGEKYLLMNIAAFVGNWVTEQEEKDDDKVEGADKGDKGSEELPQESSPDEKGPSGSSE